KWRWSMHSSRYQYAASIGWTTLLAFGLAPLVRRSPRKVSAIAAACIVVLAIGHVAATRNDAALTAPRARTDHAVLVERLVTAARAARGPVHDAPLPVAFPHDRRASDGVAAIAPDASVVWTTTVTPASIALYEQDPLL